MPSYYEILKVPLTASTMEIQQAIDREYAKVRLLVTHHDQSVVNQADQALAILENARTILLDPVQRAAYDSQVGTVGGLGLAFRPTTGAPMLGAAMAPPNVGGMAPAPASQVAPLSMWICSSCQTPNRPQSKFCAKCGQALSRFCAKCGAANDLSVEFCSNCGTNIQEYIQQKEIEHQKHLALERQRQEELARFGPIMKDSQLALTLSSIGAGLTVFLGACTYGVAAVPGAVLMVIGLLKGLAVTRASQVPGDAPYRSKAKTAVWISGIVLALTGIGIALAILAVIIGAMNNALQ